MGLFALLVMSCGFLFGAPVLKNGVQQQALTFKTGAGGSMLLPTPTATTPPPTATPPPRPTQPPSSGGGSVTGIIQAVFGSYSDAAIAVARCESSLNPSATNPTSIGGSHAAGLFQILYPSTWNTTSQAGNSPYDAQSNTQAAYEIFQRDGYNWHEWSCQP
ncbi:MAG TPA: transglycosylase SLT domain-containing protein [Ktedonobacterales bacterium]|nr:transglycosylase SLT domain-containing protein [Ktedonobacterales bacterium]